MFAIGSEGGIWETVKSFVGIRIMEFRVKKQS